jgi:hypothetical protein
MDRSKLGLTIAALLLGIVAQPCFAGGIWQFTEGFEESPSTLAKRGWFLDGIAGFDYNIGNAHTGLGNAWVRANSGWNSVNIWLRPPGQNLDCTAQAWIRLSSDLTGGYFSIRGGNGQSLSPVINEVELIGPWTAPDEVAYLPYSFNFNTGDFPEILLYVGMWGNGTDEWEQIDDVAVSCHY